MILKSLRTLDKRLESDGYEVEWKEFQAAAALFATGELYNHISISLGRVLTGSNHEP
ncbi:hypothetical protein [Bacillus canaveralius]|uniref:hypothetical protein n=1 Tax=Bacillus canaveralius TaxID=1403243 RepID=UPI0015E0B099|nr:hypothetical protein [Bacillus canaveralius]